MSTPSCKLNKHQLHNRLLRHGHELSLGTPSQKHAVTMISYQYSFIITIIVTFGIIIITIIVIVDYYLFIYSAFSVAVSNWVARQQI